MKLERVLESKLDASVNFIFTGDFPGFLEARYVRRVDDYFVVYLSSQSGCDKTCRMCHLTATGQTKHIDASASDILEQATEVLNFYDKAREPAQVVHYNFMARGEALASEIILKENQMLFQRLADRARYRHLFPRFLISTIMPKEMTGKELTDVFPVIHPEIYYSIYSVNPKFRKKWLPKSLPVELALAKLVEYQYLTKKIPKLHFAFIEGENDSASDVRDLCRLVKDFGLRVDVNIVRYNSFSKRYGKESSDEVLDRNVAILKEEFPTSDVSVIPRVGLDVHASCGTFVA